MKLRKVPVKPLIEMLMEAYNNGLDFVDVVGSHDDVQDMLGLGFYEEYYSREQRKTTYVELEEDEEEFKLSRDVLDQLTSL